jgi:hypothetical protein
MLYSPHEMTMKFCLAVTHSGYKTKIKLPSVGFDPILELYEGTKKINIDATGAFHKFL